MLGSQEDLLERLVLSPKPTVFVVGAAICAPAVPGSLDMVDRVLEWFEGKRFRRGRGRSLRDNVAALPPYQRYPYAFEHLIRTAGVDEANAIVRAAVHEACNESLTPDSDPYKADWRLPRAVAALGRYAALGNRRFAAFRVLGAGIGLGLGLVRGPFVPGHYLVCGLLRLVNPPSSDKVRCPRLLPTQWDEVIYFPLPFLRGLLVQFAENDPSLGQRLIEQAAANIGQRAIARSALQHLQRKALDAIARSSHWTWPDAPFLPTADKVGDEDPLRIFVAAAANLSAVTMTERAQQRRRRLLKDARSTLESARANIITGKRKEQVWLEPIRTWLAAVDRLEAALNAEEPEVPDVFQEGNRLNRDNIDHRDLFKGRRDLVAIIDRDLSAKQKAPLLLTGQRRMGKSSLLQMLPRLLGTIETVVVIDFQQVAGQPDRGQPHRILAQHLHAALPELPTPPEAETWGPTLEWMAEADAALAARDHRVLLALDEIERLQDGIKAGWAPPDFLDFLRAAGDRLEHIRLLLVSAHPIQRLGPVWCDRLISASHAPSARLSPTRPGSCSKRRSPAFRPSGRPDRWIASVDSPATTRSCCKRSAIRSCRRSTPAARWRRPTLMSNARSIRP